MVACKSSISRSDGRFFGEAAKMLRRIFSMESLQFEGHLFMAASDTETKMVDVPRYFFSLKQICVIQKHICAIGF